MTTNLSLIVSEFDTDASAESHDAWFRAKVAASLEETGESIPHDQVMAEMDALIAEIEKQQQKLP